MNCAKLQDANVSAILSKKC